MGQVIPLKKHHGLRKRRTYEANFALKRSTIMSSAIITFIAVLLFPQSWISGAAPLALAEKASADTGIARFGYCHEGGGYNCVVDGDTIHYRGEKIRIADIDTPETHPPRCAREAELGNAATKRLHALLNAGPFSMVSIDRDTDRYGRKLRTVMRDGQSLGKQLVSEGLARYYAGGRQPWC
jgi:micrococcal nuclease